MSFRIHASGGARYHYIRPKCADGEMIQNLAFLSALRSGELAPANHIVPSAETVHQNGLQAIARRTGIHLLRSGVEFLAMQPGARRGWISVYARKNISYWPDKARMAKFYLAGGDAPAYAFMKRMMPVLKETGMDNFGVFLQLAQAIGGYSSHMKVRKHKTPMLSIQLNTI